MSTDPLTGVWRGPSTMGFPDEEDILWVDESRGRIILFMVLRIDPPRRGPVRMWYERLSPTSIRTAPQLDGHWAQQEYRFEGDSVIWRFKTDWACQRLLPDDYPQWLEAKVAEAYKKMDEQEARARA